MSLLFTLFLVGAALLIAIGMYGIVVTRNLMRIILSVEILTKAVTLVMIGAGYETCFERDPNAPGARERLEALASRGVLNRSAQHVDVVCDFRPGGCGRRVSIDGRPIVVKDGLWVPG